MGTLFGGAILLLKSGADLGTLPIAELLSRGTNEVLFPVGCSLVIFSAKALRGRRVAYERTIFWARARRGTGPERGRVE